MPRGVFLRRAVCDGVVTRRERGARPPPSSGHRQLTTGRKIRHPRVLCVSVTDGERVCACACVRVDARVKVTFSCDLCPPGRARSPCKPGADVGAVAAGPLDSTHHHGKSSLVSWCLGNGGGEQARRGWTGNEMSITKVVWAFFFLHFGTTTVPQYHPCSVCMCTRMPASVLRQVLLVRTLFVSIAIWLPCLNGLWDLSIPQWNLAARVPCA